MKPIILIFILSLTIFSAQGQTSFCGTPSHFSNALSGVPTQFMNNQGPYLIRVFFHAVRNSSGTNGVTNAQILDALQILQTDFNPHNICFSLAGIDSINNDDYMTWADNCPGGPSTGANDDNDFDQLINTNVSNNAIDVYILPDNIYNQGQASGIPGRACVIGGSLTFNGINSILRSSKVLSHEVGHCLGLFHTFHGTCTCEQNGTFCSGSITDACSELVNGTNGTTCGDFVQDSPADPITLFYQSLGSNCTWNNTSMRDANNQLYNPDERIIMAYTYPQCMQLFTSGQGQRMRDMIVNSTVLQLRTVPTDVFVQNRNMMSGIFLFASLNTITAGNNVTSGTQGDVNISSSATCQFTCRNSITLKPGFSATPTGSGMFSAVIQQNLCDINQTNSARPPYNVDLYTSLLTNNKKWLTTIYGFDGNINSEYYLDNDTIINDVKYTKIREKYVRLNFLNNDQHISGFGRDLFIREDELSKKVFTMTLNGDEKLLYDFSLTLGNEHPNYPEYVLSVIDTFSQDGEKRERFTFSNGTQNIVWIEGIGNLANPFILHANEDGSMKLLCVSQDYTNIYRNENIVDLDCENYLLSSLSDSNPKYFIKIFPNPGSDYINIEFSKGGIFESLYLTDNIGRRFMDKNIGISKKVILDVSNLDSGIYYVNFINKETVFTKKVLILK